MLYLDIVEIFFFHGMKLGDSGRYPSQIVLDSILRCPAHILLTISIPYGPRKTSKLY